MYITQGSNSSFSHKGIMANDVRGRIKGIKYPYYAPCDCKCVKVYKESGQAMWQSLNKVRFANGRIDYATFMTAHDNSFDAYVGLKVPQGNQLGNMGDKGVGTGVHCHIQISQSADTSWYRKSSFVMNGKRYSIYGFNNEYDLDDCYFVDNTNILQGMGGNWRTTNKVPVVSNNPSVDNKKQYVNLPPSISSWNIYKVNSAPVNKNAIGRLNPKKFGGLSYYIYQFKDNNTTVVIDSKDYGKVKIYIKDTCATITTGKHKYNKGSF